MYLVLEVSTNAYCHRDYSYIGSAPFGIINECVSIITAGQQISLILYEKVTIAGGEVSGWVTSISTAQSATVMAAVHLNGWNFAPITTKTQSITTETQPITTETQPIPTTPLPSNPANATDDISRNIGIGVGVSLGTIGILSICFAIWHVRRRRPASPSYVGPQMSPRYEMESTNKSTIQEIDAPDRHISEVAGNQFFIRQM
jgi:hypothetical protein